MNESSKFRYEIDSGKQLAKLLEKHGWELLRVQGSHYIYGKSGNESKISIPVHKLKL